MRFDMHIHTQKCKIGDGDNREINTNNFISIIEKEAVQLCSITNHNYFDLDEYTAINNCSNKTFVIWPGIEMDVFQSDSSKCHIIIICDPEKATEFKKTFNYEKKDADKVVIKIEDLISKIKEFNTDEIFLVAHYKKPKLDEKSFYKLKSDLGGYTIFYEPSDFTGLGILNAHSLYAILGSDVKDWSNYDGTKLAEMRFSIRNFKKFLEFSRRDAPVIKQTIDDFKSVDITYRSKEEIEYKLTLFNDLNIIYGPKGGGKSVVLSQMFEYLNNHTEIKVTKFNSNASKNEYTKLLEKLKGRNNKSLEESAMENINEIIHFKPTQTKGIIQSYILHFSKERENNNLNLFKKRKVTYSYDGAFDIDKEINELRKNHEILKNYTFLTEQYNKAYITYIKNNNLIIKEEMISKLIEKYITHKKKSSTGKSIRSIKNVIAKKTDTAPRPDNCGFTTFINNKINLINNCACLKAYLDDYEYSEDIKVADVPGKGALYINYTYYAVQEVSHSQEINNIQKMKRFYKLLNEIKKNIYKSTDIQVQIKEALDKTLDGDTLSKFIIDNIVNKVTKTILICENGDQIPDYEPSGGEEKLIMLSNFLLDDSSDVYLLDEAENGIGHAFVKNYLIKKINDLVSRNKTVVMVSHDANIAISTLPINHIYSDIFGKGTLYIGDMYSGLLTSIVDENKQIEFKESALEHMEGSEELLKRRINIYGI